MSLWIRTQDKKKLLKLKRLEIQHYGTVRGEISKRCFITINDACGIGDYSTEEKAIKVLDMIQQKIIEIDKTRFYGREMIMYSDNVFQMPQDDEVE